MNIILFGRDGQVGWELQRSLSTLGTVYAFGRDSADLSRPESLRAIIRTHSPHVIVNAAAYTAVDKAESDFDTAMLVNADAPGVMAEEARRLKALFVHYSTDYVFSGDKDMPYTELDVCNPLSAYGVTKFQGEHRVRQTLCRHLIFRTSWVYAARGGNFAKTMLRLASERDSLRVVADQYGAPTSAELIADVTALAIYQLTQAGVLRQNATGTYHLAAAGHTTWYAYAKFVLQCAKDRGVELKVSPEALDPIATKDYPLPAPRPRNSRLSSAKLARTFSLTLPDWQFHVRRMMAEIHPGK